MSERILQIDTGTPLEVYGPGDAYLAEIKEFFPKLKIIARGEMIKLIGEEAELNSFEKRFDLLLLHLDRFGKITESVVKQIMGEEESTSPARDPKADDVLVYGRHGKLIKALTPNQKKMVSSCNENDLLFSIGPAGTGKTYVIAKSAITLAKKGEKVLLTAFTNRAVDNMCSYLLANGFTNFVRLGRKYSTQDDIKDYTSEAFRDKYPDKSFSELLESTPIVVATTSTISAPSGKTMN